MICHGCDGRGRRGSSPLPCPECGGSGVVSCCDGAVGCAGEIRNGEAAPLAARPTMRSRWARELAEAVVGAGLGLVLLTSAPAAAVERVGDTVVCFTPGDRCDLAVVAAIEAARISLHVQAYQLSSAPIVAEVLAAHYRGVAVVLIVDKATAHQRGEGVDRLAEAGVPVFVDHRPRIAHNKVAVIDGRTVVTGSFNWSAGAQCCNAENLLVVERPELAAVYEANFRRRLAASDPFERAIAAQ